MTGKPVVAEIHGSVGLARLSLPDTRNALSADLMDHLAALVEAWDADPALNCIVIAGGDEYFAAGADIQAMSERTAQETLARSAERFWPRMSGCGTPLIAAVSGYALGGGWELALLCDMIVASERAEFGQPEILLGVMPGGGATQRIARVVGRQRAMELILTGRRINAHEAMELGLVNQIAPKRRWLTQALELAEIVARRPPLAVRLAKEAVLAAEETGLEDGLARERRLHEASLASEDRLEGMQAFLEKRRPHFKGR